MYHNGSACAGCEIIMSTFIAYENLHNEKPEDFIYNTWPKMFGGLFPYELDIMIRVFGPDV